MKKRPILTVLMVLGVFTVGLQQVEGTETFNDGETHYVGRYIPNCVYVYDSPSGDPTTVIFDSGSSGSLQVST